jgi:hypothetical protein
MQHLTNHKYEILIAQAYAGSDISLPEVNELCGMLDKAFDISYVASAYAVADLHQYKMRVEEGLVKKALTRRDKKTFEFFLAKN